MMRVAFIALSLALTGASFVPARGQAPQASAVQPFLAIIKECEKREHMCAGSWRRLRFDIRDASSTLTTPAGTTWTVACNSDTMTDRKSCNLKGPGHGSDRPTIMLLWLPSIKPPAASILFTDSHYPGSLHEFRVDQQRRFTASEDSVLPPYKTFDLVQQMKAGTLLKLRMKVWPFDSYRESVVSLDDFAAVYDAANALARNYLD